MNQELSKYDPMYGVPRESVKDRINYLRHSYKWHKDEGFIMGAVTVDPIGSLLNIGRCYFVDFAFGTNKNKYIYDRVVIGEFELKELNLPKITDLFITPAGNKHLINYIMGNEASLIKD